MRLTELEVDIADILISDEQSQPRSVGLHVSSIINYILTTTGLSDKRNDFDDDDLNMFAIVGRLWEQMLANILFKPPRYQRPGEIECDGIYGSPDAVDCDDACLMEFKVTWKSSSRPIESSAFIKYIAQVKAYCHMLGLSKVRLYVFFVCGNWKPPIPQFKAWEIEFSRAELKTNWDMIVRNGKEMA
jgi:hypothetical protein